MQALPYVLAAGAAGAAIAIQPALNAVVARSMGSPFSAAVISHVVALLAILLVVLVVGAGEMTREALVATPWWAYSAGVIGMVFVASGIVIAPVTGALLYFVCIITGQLIGSSIADHFGAFGLEVRELSPLRLAGVALVILGAVLVARG